MKPKLAAKIAISTFIALVVLAIIIVRDIESHSWDDYTRHQINHLASLVSIYKSDLGMYPNNFKELSRIASNDVLNPIVNGQSKTEFTFMPSSNGFSISASKPSRWIFRSMHLQLVYTNGVAIKKGAGR